MPFLYFLYIYFFGKKKLLPCSSEKFKKEIECFKVESQKKMKTKKNINVFDFNDHHHCQSSEYMPYHFRNVDEKKMSSYTYVFRGSLKLSLSFVWRLRSFIFFAQNPEAIFHASVIYSYRRRRFSSIFFFSLPHILQMRSNHKNKCDLLSFSGVLFFRLLFFLSLFLR